MQDIIKGLILLLQFKNIFFLFAGVLSGIIVGALPGMGGILIITLILPFTYSMRPDTAMSLLIAVYCGSVYAGCVSGILFNIPGTGSGAASSIDGHELAKKGRAGDALAYSAASSFIGGVIGALICLTFAPLVARLALLFGAAEYSVLAFFGITIIASVSQGSLLKGLIGGFFGILLGTVGMGANTGYFRYTFGFLELADGINMVWGITGLFAFSQAFQLCKTEDLESGIAFNVEKFSFKHYYNKILKVMAKHKMLILKSGIVGAVIGAIPGTGAEIASWIAYNEAKRENSKIGTGEEAGVIAPEVANNACIGGALIPTLTLGIPGSSTMSLILGGLMLAGLRPGFRLFSEQGPYVYSIIFSIIVSSAIFFVLGLLVVPYLAKLTSVPIGILIPMIIALATIGAFTARFSLFGVYISLVIGVIAYFFRVNEVPIPPVILGLILGPIVEEHLARALIISNGSLKVFFTGYINIFLWFAIVLSVGITIYNEYKVKLNDVK